MNRKQWENAFSQCTPAEVRAWFTTLALPAEVLRTRPGAALARLLDVERCRGRQLINRLVEVGVLIKVAGRGVGHANFPRGGVLVGGSGNLAGKADASGPPKRIVSSGSIADTAYIACTTCGNHPISEPDMIPVTVFCKKNTSTAPATIWLQHCVPDEARREAHGPASPSPCVPARAASRPKRHRLSMSAIAEVDHLAALYEGERRRFQSSYDRDEELTAACARLLASLRRHKVAAAEWRLYVKRVFVWNYATTQGRLRYPPPGTFASERYVARFVRSLGQRRYSLPTVGRMLRGEGFDTKSDFLDPQFVLELAVLYESHDPDPDATFDPETWRTVRWLRSRLHAVPFWIEPSFGRKVSK